MNTSPVTIQPSSSSLVAPSSANSSDQTADTSFSDELSRAKSKPSNSSNAQKPPAKKASTKLTPDDSKTKSTPEKTKTKVPQKQAPPTDTSTDADGKSQAKPQPQNQPSDPTEDQADPDATDTEADSTHVVAHGKLAALPSLPTTDATEDSSDTDATPVTSKGNKPAKNSNDPASPTDLATLLAAAAAQQPAAHTATPAKVVASSGTENTDEKQAVAKVSVSPFKSAHSPADPSADLSADPQTAAAPASPAAQTPDKTKPVASIDADPAAQLLVNGSTNNSSTVSHVQQATPAAPPPPTLSPDAQFTDSNHPSIVAAIHSNLLPNGGAMSIRLDPPELGAIQINVRMENGIMSASFQTSNDQATRLLSNTLSQLKTALETQGMSVDRLHVHQASSTENSSGQGKDSESNGRQSSADDRNAQQDQQRRDVLRRMWRRVRGNRDPLDLVA